MKEFSRRSFMQIAGLSALGAASPRALSQAISACAPGNLFLVFDIVVLPARPSSEQCGADEPGLWLVLRPMIFVNRSDPGSGDGLNDYIASLDADNGLSPILWNCPCSVPSDSSLVPMHVNLPTSWQLRVVAYDNKGVQIDGLQKNLDRPSRLRVLDWDALQHANRPPMPGVPVTSSGRLATVPNGDPYVKIFNDQLKNSLSGDSNTCDPQDFGNSLVRVLEQTDLALSHGTRRYVHPGKTIEWHEDGGLMVLRRSAGGIIETNTHSLLGLAVRLDTGVSPADLARVSRLGFAFRDSVQSPPKALAAAADSLPSGWCDTDVAADRTALPKVFQTFATALNNCGTFIGEWDPKTTGPDAVQNPLQLMLVAGRTLHSARNIGVVKPEAGVAKDRSVWLPNDNSRSEASRGPLRGLIWFGDIPLDAPATLGGAIHDAWVCRLTPYRKYCAKGTGRVYQLEPKPEDRKHLLTTIERWRSQDSHSPAGGGILTKRGDLRDFLWVSDGTLIDSVPILRRFPWDGSDQDNYEHLFLVSNSAIVSDKVYLIAKTPRTAGPFKSDADTLKMVYQSAAFTGNALNSKASTSSLHVPDPGPDDSPSLVALLEGIEPTGSDSSLHFEFRNDVSLRMAQSQSSVLGRLAVSHRCGSAADNEREALLGDRRTYVALNVYEDLDPNREAERPVIGAYLDDPIIRNPPSRLRWLNPQVELYPITQDKDLSCTSTATPACAVQSSYWFQIKEPYEFGPYQFSAILQTMASDKPLADSCESEKDKESLTDAVKIPPASSPPGIAILKSGVAPAMARDFIRDFFQRTYARAMRGSRSLTFRVEGTFGTEADVTCGGVGTIPVHTLADWPVANAADVWTSPQKAKGNSTESRGSPFLRVSRRNDGSFTFEMNENILTPLQSGLSTELSACLDAWQAVAEIANAMPSQFRIGISAHRFNRAEPNAARRTHYGFQSVLLDSTKINDLAVIATGLQQRCMQLIEGTDQPSTSFKAYSTSSIDHPEVKRAHALSITIDIVRAASMAPASSDPKSWPEWTVTYPAATAIAIQGAGGTPQPDSLVAASSTVEIQKKGYLEARVASSATVPRWPRPGGDARDQYTRAFAALLLAEHKSVAGSSEWFILPPSVATAAPCLSGNPQPLLIPMVFRAPIGVVRDDVVDTMFGDSPFQAIERLSEALQALIDGEACQDVQAKADRLLALHGASVTIDSLINSMASLIWPAYDADVLQFDRRMSDTGKKRLTERTRALQTDASPERTAVIEWCKQALRNDPSLFRQSRALLYVESTNESAPLPDDYCRAVIGLGFQPSNTDPAKATRTLTVTAELETRLSWGGAVGLGERVASVLPLTDKHIGATVDVLWFRLERFEAKLNSFVPSADNTVHDLVQRDFSETLDVPNDPLSISAPWSTDANCWRLPLPARSPVTNLRIASAGVLKDFSATRLPASVFGNSLALGRIDDSKHNSGMASLVGAIGYENHEVQFDQYLARFALEILGDESENLAADTLHIAFETNLVDDTALSPPISANVNSPLSTLLRLSDFRQYFDLSELVCHSLLDANSDFSAKKVDSSAKITFEVADNSKSTFESCDWPCIQLSAIKGSLLRKGNSGTPGVVQLALYRKAANADQAGIADAPGYLVVVDVLLSRWQSTAVNFQQIRNGDAGKPTGTSRFNGAFVTKGNQIVGTVAPIVGAEVNVKGLPQETIPHVNSRSLTVASLLKQIAPQISLSDPIAAQTHQLSIIVHHAQRIEMDDFLLDNYDGPMLLCDEAYVPLKQGHWVLDPATDKTMETYGKQSLQIGGLVDLGVRNFAIDLEWRNVSDQKLSGNAMLLRINHARLNLIE